MGVRLADDVSRDSGEFEVALANEHSVRVWLASASQWRAAIGAAGLVWLGLDYAGVDVVLRRLAPPDPDAVFLDLQLMEAEALAVFHEEAS